MYSCFLFSSIGLYFQLLIACVRRRLKYLKKENFLKLSLILNLLVLSGLFCSNFAAPTKLQVLYAERDYRTEGASAPEWKEVNIRSSTEIIFQPQNASKIRKFKLSSIISLTLSAWSWTTLYRYCNPAVRWWHLLLFCLYSPLLMYVINGCSDLLIASIYFALK